MRAVLFTLLTLVSFQCVAFDWSKLWFDVNIGSHHTHSTYTWKGEVYEFNETNPGFGVTYELDSFMDLKVGLYDNSYHTTSVYAGINFKHDLLKGKWRLEPGILIGGVTGYDGPPQLAPVVAPVFLPNISIGKEVWRVNLGILPARLVNDTAPNVYTLQAQYRFFF